METTDLAERLRGIPRVALCQTPSPLEEWNRLTRQWVPSARILAKRDDTIGPGYGGNKSRQLEFLLGDALSQDCDIIIHGGSVQSNYCRQLAAAAAILGVECRLVLTNNYGQPIDQGSHLLDRLFGAHVTLVDCPLGEEHERIKAGIRDDLQAAGRRPDLITYPQSETLGSLGYVVAAIELAEQWRELGDVRPTRVVSAAVGATYAGLLLGLRLLGYDTPVIGFSPLAKEYDILGSVAGAIRATAKLLDVTVPPSTLDEIDIRYDFVGEGYGAPSTEGLAALRDVARTQGVLLDPVYTSKAMAGLRAITSSGETSVFLHTGGAPAIFAYAGTIAASLEAADA
jgi:1-aminocyclopropane-1-carboxylate deaminase/D-cysteine desulfhydrase-like pyridoxal-dependent ACC family enzyme